jgi:polysaccharide deacetylase family protein (PEP-CTERM system associated)
MTRATNILTIDVEEWHHGLALDPARSRQFAPRVPDQVHHVLDILDAAQTRATFFVLGRVADAHPGVVHAIDRAGHEIASHGYDHAFVYRRTPADFEADVARSRAVLESLVDQPVQGFRAPYFSITDRSRWALPIVRGLGFRYDSSVFPVVNHRYGMPGAARGPHPIIDGLLELPPATYRIGHLNVPCGGGAYLRIWPYALTRWFFRRLNARDESVIVYLHPWELDPAHPDVRTELSGSVKVTHYWNLDRTKERLIRLLGDFRFGPARAMLP